MTENTATTNLVLLAAREIAKGRLLGKFFSAPDKAAFLSSGVGALADIFSPARIAIATGGNADFGKAVSDLALDYEKTRESLVESISAAIINGNLPASEVEKVIGAFVSFNDFPADIPTPPTKRGLKF